MVVRADRAYSGAWFHAFRLLNHTHTRLLSIFATSNLHALASLRHSPLTIRYVPPVLSILYDKPPFNIRIARGRLLVLKEGHLRFSTFPTISAYILHEMRL